MSDLLTILNKLESPENFSADLINRCNFGQGALEKFGDCTKTHVSFKETKSKKFIKKEQLTELLIHLQEKHKTAGSPI